MEQHISPDNDDSPLLSDLRELLIETQGAVQQLDIPAYGIYLYEIGGRVFFSQSECPGPRALAEEPTLLESAEVLQDLSPGDLPRIRLRVRPLSSRGELETRRIIAALPENAIEVRFELSAPDLFARTFNPSTWQKWCMSRVRDFDFEMLVRQPRLADILGQPTARFAPGQTILFLGPGRGFDMVAFLSANSAWLSPKTHIIGVDSSASSLGEAARQVEGLFPQQITFERRPQFTWLSRDMLESLPALASGSIDMIVAVGILDGQTLDFEQGVQLLEEMHRLLVPSGVAHCYAWGPELFFARHYREMGFAIERSASKRFLFEHGRLSGYVIRKASTCFSNPPGLAARISTERLRGTDQFRDYLSYVDAIKQQPR